jgi:hypothetical protein
MITLSALAVCTSAFADLPFPMTLIPGNDRSIVIANVVPTATNEQHQPINVLRVHSGYPRGVTIMQRLTLWSGKSIDMHYTVKPGRLRTMSHKSSCFLNGKRMTILTSSYKVETMGRVESRSGSTMIHGYRC